MDELDAAILREVCREQVLLWGGGDTRLTTSLVAERLKVDRTTVWSRLRAWREAGFLVRQEVIPNPSLFGAGVAAGDIQVGDPRRKGEAVERLQLVDGVLAGFDQVGPFVLLVYALESRAALDRCTRLVGTLPGVDEVSMCVPLRFPASTVEPTRADWGMLRALRASEGTSLDTVAKEVGVSRRTLTRRYQRLLDGNALWSFPVLDFTRYTDAVMARFVAILSGAGSSKRFLRLCRSGLPQMVWSVPFQPPAGVEEAPDEWAEVFCHLRSAGEVEDVRRWVLGQPAVTGVEVYYPRAWFVAGSWFDERIEARLERA